MHRNGQAVVITIRDEHNPHSPVTVCRGIVTSPERVEATCNDGHPVWHGAVLRYGCGVTFKAAPPNALAGMKTHSRPVRCHACRTLNTLTTAKRPYKCWECHVGDGKRRS